MEQSLQQAVLEQSDIHMQKVKLGTYLILFTNINLKHIIDQHITKKATKFIVDNIVENLVDLGNDNHFLDKNTTGKIYERIN